MVSPSSRSFYDLIVVNLNVTPAGPTVNPPSLTAYWRRRGGDTVQFQSRLPFEIAFKGPTPFEWKVREGQPVSDGQYVAHGTVQLNALPEEKDEGSFEYGLTLAKDGETFEVDPEVVVKKDPKG